MTHEEAEATAVLYAAREGGYITQVIQLHGGEWAVSVIPYKRTAIGKYKLDLAAAYLVREVKTA